MIEGVCHMKDLFFRGAMNETFRLQAGRKILAARLCITPFFTGCNMQDHGITS
jgi:hypothetical protein